jgi:predicted O-methyltransferase YrrM
LKPLRYSIYLSLNQLIIGGKYCMTSEAALFHNPPAPMFGSMTPCTVGSMNYHVLATLIRDADLLRLERAAEIGVLDGDTSNYILKSFPKLKLYSIDPYLEYEKFEANRTQENMGIHERTARAKLAQYGERSQIVKDFSVLAAARFADDSLDFVFIDALHTYEAVKSDIEAWFPKVRSQGMVMGHDISWPGISQAVGEFGIARQILTYMTPSTSDVWFFVKP